MKWTHVKDALPEPVNPDACPRYQHSEWMLVYSAHGSYDVAMYWPHWHGEIGSWDTGNQKLKRVTHWMLLPGPPEEQE